MASTVALLRGEAALLFPVAVLAMWFSLGGHYVESAFLNGLRHRLPPDRVVQTLMRLIVWWCGGVLLFQCMVTTARFFWVDLPLRKPWWFGGLLFIGVELAVHAALAIRRAPSFYDGRG